MKKLSYIGRALVAGIVIGLCILLGTGCDCTESKKETDAPREDKHFDAGRELELILKTKYKMNCNVMVKNTDPDWVLLITTDLDGENLSNLIVALSKEIVVIYIVRNDAKWDFAAVTVKSNNVLVRASPEELMNCYLRFKDKGNELGLKCIQEAWRPVQGEWPTADKIK